MKKLLLLILLLSGFTSFSQTTDTTKNQAKEKSNIVSFTTKLDITKAQKGGFYLNGYIVDIDYSLAKKITGKKIRVTGEVTIVKGLKNDSEYKKGILKSGWLEDTKHIDNPKVEVLK